MKKLISQLPTKAFLMGMALLFASCGQDNRTDTDTDTTTTTTTEARTDTDMMAEDRSRHDMQGGRMGGMRGHMHRHMQDMQEMRPQMTGDPDFDFATMMTRHHQGGIQMAEEQVASGTDNQLKDMANRIIKSNREDVQKLQDFTNTHKPTTGDTASTMRMMQPMRKMMGGMGQGRMGMDMDTTSTDRSFASMMIRHHQMGNEMTREFLKQGKTPQMKQMAQKIVNQQEKEIKELEAWQTKNKQ
jgi:uncharacterized protein (DUF305 family)